jgi:F0F1-type ATP synthase membrane subunit b/b'
MAISMPRRAGAGRRGRRVLRAALLGGAAALACRSGDCTHNFVVGQRAGQRWAQPARTQRYAKETVDPTELIGKAAKEAEESFSRLVNAPSEISNKAKRAAEETVENFSKDNGKVLDENSAAGSVGAIAVSVAVLPYIPVSIYSSWLVATTGSGVDPGPNGLFGAAEGIATLVVALVALWSLTSFVTRARGLPNGPLSSLGATQALSWVAVLGFAGASALSGGNNLNPLGERREPAVPAATLELEKELDEFSKAPTNFLSQLQKQLDTQVEKAKKQVDSQLDGVKKQVDSKVSGVVERASESASKAASSATAQVSKAAEKAADTVAEKAKEASKSLPVPKQGIPDIKDLLDDAVDDE